MATRSGNSQLQKLQAENKQLRQDNAELRKRLNGKPAQKPQSSNSSLLRKIGVILFISLPIALLLVGNLLFWAGNTITKTDRYVEATAPIIQDAQVQDALATRISQRLFENVDIEQVTEEALPPRAAFLAPTLSDRIQQYTDDAIKKILERPQFQERWNGAQERAHSRFIELIGEHGSDGSIDISEVYTDVSEQLKDTKLAFLADKPLPAKAGNIQLVSGDWLSIFQRTIENIDTWRVIAILLLVVTSVIGVWLSRNRRKAVIFLSSFIAFSMFITLVGMRVIREVVANGVDPLYSEATRQAYSIFFHSLAVQTFTILFTALTIICIAWISGPSASSRTVRSKIDQLLSGKLHVAIFGNNENSFTRWVGKYKAVLQWLSVGLVACAALFTRLTPAVLITQIGIIIVSILLIELLAAKPLDSQQ